MSELEIAQENIRLYKKSNEDRGLWEWICSHKQTCQRFLKYLNKECGYANEYESIFDEKKQDLKQTIKLYKDNGIK